MERIISDVFREYCDINDREKKTLADALIARLQPYLKPKPTLRILSAQPHYKILQSAGTIVDHCMDQYHGVILYDRGYRMDLLTPLVKQLFHVDYYPMYLDIQPFGNNMILLRLYE